MFGVRSEWSNLQSWVIAVQPAVFNSKCFIIHELQHWITIEKNVFYKVFFRGPSASWRRRLWHLFEEIIRVENFSSCFAFNRRRESEPRQYILICKHKGCFSWNGKCTQTKEEKKSFVKSSPWQPTPGKYFLPYQTQRNFFLLSFFFFVFLGFGWKIDAIDVRDQFWTSSNKSRGSRFAKLRFYVL